MAQTADIPAALEPPAHAALKWINASQQQTFELTGLVETEAALGAQAGEAYELGLVLCDGEICARQQVRVQTVGDDYQFALVEAAERAIPPLLDPPQGVRASWLSNVMARHEFVLLLFYRGLW